MEKVTIKYYFLLENGEKKSFVFQLDPLDPERPENLDADHPEWTRLDFHQCPICPYDPEERVYCPLAVNLVDIIQRFDGLLSYEKVYLRVVSKEREVSKKTTVQHGMSSLMGLAIAASGCPHTSFLAPMAHFHMPLASVKETVFRAVSSFLLSEYFLKQEGKNPDFELGGLTEIYRNLQVVNSATASRLRMVTASDSTVNAIILLDTFAQSLPIVLDTALQDIRKMYAPYHASTMKLPEKKKENGEDGLGENEDPFSGERGNVL